MTSSALQSATIDDQHGFGHASEPGIRIADGRPTPATIQICHSLPEELAQDLFGVLAEPRGRVAVGDGGGGEVYRVADERPAGVSAHVETIPREERVRPAGLPTTTIERALSDCDAAGIDVAAESQVTPLAGWLHDAAYRVAAWSCENQLPGGCMVLRTGNFRWGRIRAGRGSARMAV
jgi:hypothetical protein